MGPIELIRYIAKYIIESVEFVLLNAFLCKPGKGIKTNPEKILIVQLNAIGDVIMSSSTVKALRNRFPDKVIDIIVLPHIKELVDNDPHINTAFTCSDRFWRHISKIKSSVDEIKEIRQRKYDLCIDMGGTFGSVVLSLLSGSKSITGPLRQLKCGMFSGDTARFYNKTVEQKEKHIVKRYMELVAFMGCETPDHGEEIYPSDDEKQKGYEFLGNKGLEEGKYAVIHPGAKWRPKRWPEEHFSALVKILKQKAVLIGGSGDRELLNTIKEGSNREETLVVTEMSLSAMAGIIERASFFVGNDSAPAHMAGALGKKGIVLFGPTDPDVSAPVSDNMTVLHDRISCWPCKLYFRRDRCEREENFCLKGIEPHKVIEAIEGLDKDR